jgi:transposase
MSRTAWRDSRANAGGVIEALAPAHINESCLPTEALLARIAVSKYADGLPLFRQEGIYARYGVEIDRRLMAQWMGRVGFELEIFAAHVLAEILTRPTWPPVPCSRRTITPAQAPEAAAQTPPANKAG